jgi:segregation and condensation protein A
LGFEIEVEEFSGPLDLLCRLVENGEMEASKVRVSDLIRTYSSYLLVEKAIPFGTVSEFISLTARLLLGKVRGLFPPVPADSTEIAVEMTENADDALREALERYRPFRKASKVLAERHAKRLLFVLRQTDEEPPVYDFGDLYSLARLWWELIATSRKPGSGNWANPSSEMLGFESPEPDFLQVERRMVELEAFLALGIPFSFKTIIRAGANRSTVVVTLLALLEMARLGQVRIIQEERFGELRFQGP